MSETGRIELRWADGTYAFCLDIGGLRELQTKVDAAYGFPNGGPILILRRLQERECHIDDIREVIRIGLIGAGTIPFEASKLVERYVDQRPFMENLPIAIAILFASLVGAPNDPVGKKKTKERKIARADLNSPPSTEPAQQ